MRSPFLLASALLSLPFVAEAQQKNVNYDEAAIGSYQLPELLRTRDGRTVQKATEWNSVRRPEVLELFESHVFGKTPPPSLWGRVAFETLSTNENALGGRAVRKLVRITLPEHPSWKGIAMMLHIQ